MPSDNQKASRRTLLKTSGAGLIGLLFTGSVSAKPEHAGQRGRPDHAGQQGPPEHANALSGVQLTNNRAELAVTEEEWTSVDASDVEGIPDDAQRVPFEVVEAQIKGINEAVAAGQMEIDKKNGRPTLRRTDKSALDELEVDQ